MTLNLSPQLEARLVEVAKQEGVEPGALVEKLLTEYRPAKESPEEQQARVRALLAKWQEETQTVTADPVSAHELFRQWDEEDALMTDEEREAEDRLWEDFLKGINETRAALGMRLL